jgi:predicted DNA-binding transcriptional regulator YafY
MANRSSADLVVAIFQAFRSQSVWKQAELARHIGIESRAVRRHLDELSRHGFPLHSEVEHPHVYWSIEKGFLPGGVSILEHEVPELLRLVARAPRSEFRDSIFARLLAQSGLEKTLERLPERVKGAQFSEAERFHVTVIEDAATQQVVLHMRYYSAHRGVVEWRRVSVYEEQLGPPARFLARCHRDGLLKWFRVDNVMAAELDSNTPFRPASREEVEAHRASSVGGFHTGAPAQEYEIFIRNPEARWAVRNAPCAVREFPAEGGARLITVNAGAPVLAAWIVSLGAAAHAVTPELRALARELALGSVQANAEDKQ